MSIADELTSIVVRLREMRASRPDADLGDELMLADRSLTRAIGIVRVEDHVSADERQMKAVLEQAAVRT